MHFTQEPSLSQYWHDWVSLAPTHHTSTWRPFETNDWPLCRVSREVSVWDCSQCHNVMNAAWTFCSKLSTTVQSSGRIQKYDFSKMSELARGIVIVFILLGCVELFEISNLKCGRTTSHPSMVCRLISRKSVEWYFKILYYFPVFIFAGFML